MNTKDFIHPHINDNIYHYRKGNVIELPPYHGCNHINRNGTRKYVDYGRGFSAFVQLKSIIGEKQKMNTT